MLRIIALAASLQVVAFANKQPELIESKPKAKLESNIFTCTFKDGGNYYELDKLKSDNDYGTNIGGTDKVINFNFCKTLVDSPCHTDNVSSGLTEGGACKGDLSGTEQSKVQLDTISMYTGDEDSEGVAFIHSGGNIACPNAPDKFYGLQIIVICDENAHYPFPTSYIKEVSSTSECFHMVEIRSDQGCAVFSTNKIWDWLDNNRYIFGAILIAFGLFVGLFGLRLFKPTICMVGTMVGLCLFSIIAVSIWFKATTPLWAGWIVFGVSLVLGMVLGLVLAKLAKLGVAVLAAWGGFCLGLVLYSAFIYKIDSDKKIAFWVVNILLAVICGVLSIWLYHHALIISTSIIGAYCFIRGISFYAGGFPNEFDLVDQIKYNGWESIPKSFYGYMGGIIATAIVFMIIQYQVYKKQHANQNLHPYFSKNGRSI